MTTSRSGQSNLTEMFSTNKKVQKVLEEVHRLFAAGKQEESEKYMEEGMTKLGLQVKFLGGSNNKNYQVTRAGTDDEKLVIQVSKTSPEAESANDAIIAKGKKPLWMPRTYASVKGKITDGSGSADTVTLTVMEFLPRNLDKVVEDLKSNQLSAQSGYSDRFEKIANISPQISQVLTFYYEHGVIWGDLKPGNLPMREDDQIVAADRKVVLMPDEIPKRKKGTYAGSILYGELSAGYLSEDFIDNKQLNTKSITEVRETWEREYSYQLAVNIHYMATTDGPRLSEPGSVTQFDFSHPIFATERGGRLKEVIEMLGKHDPLERIRHVDAVKCIQVLDNPNAFAKRKQEALENVKVSATLHRKLTSSDQVVEAIAKITKAQQEKAEADRVHTAQATDERVLRESQKRTTTDMLKALGKAAVSKFKKDGKVHDISGPIVSITAKAGADDTPSPVKSKSAGERPTSTTNPWVKPENPYSTTKDKTDDHDSESENKKGGPGFGKRG